VRLPVRCFDHDLRNWFDETVHHALGFCTGVYETAVEPSFLNARFSNQKDQRFSFIFEIGGEAGARGYGNAC